MALVLEFDLVQCSSCDEMTKTVEKLKRPLKYLKGSGHLVYNYRIGNSNWTKLLWLFLKKLQKERIIVIDIHQRNINIETNEQWIEEKTNLLAAEMRVKFCTGFWT